MGISNYFTGKGIDIGLLFLRLAVGLLMIGAHGLKKLLNFAALMDTFPDPLGMGSFFSLSAAVFSEVICSILIILGIKTRWFALPSFITMLVAALIVHAHDPFNVKEKAMLFGLIYFVLMFTGGGRYSVRD